MKRKGLALSRRLASCLLAATLAAGLAAPQAAVYAGEPDAILEEETESGEDMYTGPDEDVPEETEDPSLDLYPDAAEDSYSEPYSDPYVDASPYIDPSEDAENADAPIEDTAQEGLVPEGASGEEAQYEEAPENDEYQEGAVDAESAGNGEDAEFEGNDEDSEPVGSGEEADSQEEVSSEDAAVSADPEASPGEIFSFGSGTEEDPYVIENADQMCAFAASLGAELDYSGCTIVLGADIDLSDREWTPVGLGEYAFAGTFDGMGHCISGMHLGTQEASAQADPEHPCFGLFGTLGETAVVRNVNLVNVFVNGQWPGSSCVAGIAGNMAAVQDDSPAGAWVDNCHVDGMITAVQDSGELFIGGIAACQNEGAITNCSTELILSGTVVEGDAAKVGGIVAQVNSGLVANCWSDSELSGSAESENGLEGITAVGGLAAVDAGDVVGCRVSGSITAEKGSVYTGMVSGCVEAGGRACSSWYDGDSVMTAGGEAVTPPAPIGGGVPMGASGDGADYSDEADSIAVIDAEDAAGAPAGEMYYDGIAEGLQAYAPADCEQVADALNAEFAEYPVNITLYEIPDDALFTWAFIDGRVVLTGERIVASYVEPVAETDAQPGEEFRDDIDGSVEDAGEIITNAGEDFEEKDGSGEEETAAVISGTDEDAREIIADSGEDVEDKDGSGEEEAAGAIPGTDEDAAESVTSSGKDDKEKDDKEKDKDGSGNGETAAVIPEIDEEQVSGEALSGAADGPRGEAPVFQSGKNFGGIQTDSLLSAAQTLDGGFVAMGYSMGESQDPEWTHSGKASNNDAILLKFDQDHRLQWSKAYGGEGVEVFNSMDVLADGRIAALGRASFESADQNIKGVSWYLLLVNPDDPDDYVDYRIGGTSGDQGYGVAATADGGFVLAGWSASKSGFFTSSEDQTNYRDTVQLWEPQDGTDDGIANRVAGSGSDTIVVKFDSSGEPVFTSLHNYGVMEDAYNISSPSERLTDMTVDANGDIYIVGYHNVAKNVQDAFVAKLDGSDGSLIWHRSAGRDNNKMTEVPATELEKIKAEYNGVAVLADGTIVVSGEADNDAASEEAWRVYGANDALWVHYGADGEVLGSHCLGTICYRTTDDIGSKHASVTATPDGGFIFAGTQSGVMQSDELVAEGYDFGNYGAQDGVLVKYDVDGHVEWSENYGTRQGDWINCVLAFDDGELLVVGESNGRNGIPAWSNNGGIDGVIMSTGFYPDAYTEPVNTASNGDVVWADGSYTATGDGHGGKDAIRVTTQVEDGKIASVTGESLLETESYYSRAAALYEIIVERQTTDIDVVSRATMSSRGILEATEKTLGQAAAAHTDALIAAIDGAEDTEAAVRAAAAAYAELGSYAAGLVQGLDELKAAAAGFGIVIESRADRYEAITETRPEAGTDLSHNDTYYKLQEKYLNLINAQVFEKKGLDGDGITIAVIDSGVTPAHRDIDYDRILDGYNYDDGAEMKADALIDESGHGTAVTGILTAKADNGIGVAGLFPKLKVVPLKVTPSKKLDDASSLMIAQAINDAVDIYHVDVITTSLEVKDTDELAAAVRHAEESKVIVTGAAGNSSKAENNGEDPYVYPAAYDEVISVGAVDLNGTVRSTSQKNDKVLVTAPGEGIAVLDLSRNDRCKLAEGTSYASPLAAAMAVAAKQHDRDITPEQFREMLKATARDAGPEGFDNSYGYGIVDYAAFYRALFGITTQYEITLNRTELTITEGKSMPLSAVVAPADAENRKVLWSSSDEAVATVDGQGRVTAIAPGEAKITAACDGDDTVFAVCAVTVEKAPEIEKLEVPSNGTPNDGTYEGTAVVEDFGYSVTFKAAFSGGKLASLTDFSLKNNDDEDNEDFAGYAWDTIREKLLGQPASVDIVSGATHSSRAIMEAYKDAYAKAIAIRYGITLNKTKLSLTAGKSETLAATVTPADAENKEVLWSTSNASVATVDAAGKIIAVAPGRATITATAAAADAADTGATAVCEVTVTKPVSSIKLDKTSASVLRGKTVTLKATVSPSDAGNKAVSWSSSDKKIATVDSKGLVKGVAKGTATITVKAKDGSGVKATCKITVRQPVTKITLNKKSASILRNKTITLKATAGPSSANDKSVAWTTSNKKVATVNSKGVVKGIAKGTATITATARDGSKVKAACKITVRQPVTKITLNKKSASILRNKTITLKATAGPSSANDKSVTWTTSNKKIATVNSKGVVKGIAKGTATITATAKDGSKVKAVCKITVRQPVTKLTINKTKLTVKKGKTATLKVTVAPSSANDKSLKWTTSNKNIATVTQKGVVKGIKKGTVTITAAARDGSGKKVTCKVTVN